MIQSTKGFTIVEILMAILLLSIIILVVLGSLNGFFGLSRQATTQSTLTNQAQAIMEDVRGQWQDVVSYSKSCIKVTTAGQAPNGAVISVVDEDASGTAISGPYTPIFSTNCTLAAVVKPAAAIANAPLRRVSITMTSSGTSTPSMNSTLVLEIVSP